MKQFLEGLAISGKISSLVVALMEYVAGMTYNLREGSYNTRRVIIHTLLVRRRSLVSTLALIKGIGNGFLSSHLKELLKLCDSLFYSFFHVYS